MLDIQRTLPRPWILLPPGTVGLRAVVFVIVVVAVIIQIDSCRVSPNVAVALVAATGVAARTAARLVAAVPESAR